MSCNVFYQESSSGILLLTHCLPLVSLTYRTYFSSSKSQVEQGPKMVPILYAVFSLGLGAEASWLLFLKNAQLRAQHTRPNFKQINSAFKAMAQTKLNPILRFSGNLSIRFSTAQKPVKYFKILNQIFQPGILAF